jgi:hypothetical protein
MCKETEPSPRETARNRRVEADMTARKKKTKKKKKKKKKPKIRHDRKEGKEKQEQKTCIAQGV